MRHDAPRGPAPGHPERLNRPESTANFPIEHILKLHHLRDFLAIVESQGIRAAAKVLGIAQPSLSRSIRDLEKDLGVPLFDRHARGATLTEMGAIFARRARIAVRELEKGREEVGQVQHQVQGRVAIGMSGMVHLTLLATALLPFRRRFPSVDLEVLEGALSAFESRLKQGVIDLYVGPVPDQSAGGELSLEPLFHLPCVVLCREGNPLAAAKSLRELRDADWITMTTTDRADGAVDVLFAAHHLPAPRHSIRVDSALALMTALTGTDALAIGPGTWADTSLFTSMVTVIDLHEKLAPNSIALVTRSQGPAAPAADYLCDLIRVTAIATERRSQ